MKRNYFVFKDGPLKDSIFREFTEEEYNHKLQFVLPIKYRKCRCCGKPLMDYPYFPGKILRTPKCKECCSLNKQEQEKYKRKPTVTVDTQVGVLQFIDRPDRKGGTITSMKLYKEDE